MGNKFEDIQQKNTKDAAYLASEIEKSNFLAHTIREVETAVSFIRKMHYRVVTYESPEAKTSSSIFFERCCEIQLVPIPKNIAPTNEDEKDRQIRLTIAHELGHLFFNIDKLDQFEVLNKRKVAPEEEVYAWVFAYHMIDKKSEHHKNSVRLKKHSYSNFVLKNSLDLILDNPASKIDTTIVKEIKEALKNERGL